MRRLLPSRLNSRLFSPAQRRRAWLALWAQGRRRGRRVPAVPPPPVLSLLDGLLAYWPLDEAEGDRWDVHGVYDLAEVDYTLSLAPGSVQAVGGVVGNAAMPGFFYEDWNYGLTPWHPVFDLRQDFTLTLWLKRDWQYDEHVLSQREGFVVSARAEVYGAQLTVDFFGPGYAPHNHFEFFDSAILDQTWQHIAIVRAGNLMTVHVNGVADSNVPTITVDTGAVEDGGEFVIGPSWWGYQWGTEAYDEVGVWQRALSADEVSQLYNSGDGLAFELF